MPSSGLELTDLLALIDELSRRAEAHILGVTEEFSKQIEAIRLFSSRLEPIDERSARIEAHLLRATEELSKQIEAVRLLSSRLEPIDERSGRTEAHLLRATAKLSEQIEAVRLFSSRIETIDERSERLERQFADLAERMSPKNVSQPSAYDLVRLHEIYLYVPTNDNIYDKFIPQTSKGFSLEQAYAIAAQTVSPSLKELSRDVGKAMLLYLDFLFRDGLSVHLIDIGAWVGDVALRFAKFAKGRDANFSAECYDPSNSGALIPRNIALNGLKDFVVHKAIGVSQSGGPLIFDQLVGHSDSSRLALVDNSGMPASSYVVDTVTLAECLPEVRQKQHVMVKIDVEGIDAMLVLENLELLRDATLIVEFAPHQEQYKVHGAAFFIETLSASHSLFDIFYLPYPKHVVPVQDIAAFVDHVTRRPYAYTDVLAVPRSLSAHDELCRALVRYRPGEMNYHIG